MEKLLKVSSSPHVRDGVTTQRLMFDVVIAMIPASVYGVWQFGMNALLVLIATVIASVAAEYLYEKLMHKPLPPLLCSALFQTHTYRVFPLFVVPHCRSIVRTD